jgi:hypothetical protein
MDYDFVIDNAAILTVEVGGSQPIDEHIAEKTTFVKTSDLDQILYNLEATLNNENNDKTIDNTLPHEKHNNTHLLKSLNPEILNLDIFLCENTRHDLFNILNEAFGIFLEETRMEARKCAKMGILCLKYLETNLQQPQT